MENLNVSKDPSEKVLPGEIKSVPSSQEILKILECPICLEPPVPPIKTCSTGHIICSFCRPRLTRCAICRETYTESRNFPLETIFNGCTIACKFWGRGCQQIVSGGRYLEHVKICQYRTLCCSHCHESISPVDKYVNHLKDKHEAIGYDEEKSSYEYKHILSDDLYNDKRFPDQYAFYDGKYFIVSVQIRHHFLHIWLSIVENLSADNDNKTPENSTKDDNIAALAEIKKKAEHSDYTAVISISPETVSAPKATWTLPIYPLQNGDPDPALIVNIPVSPTFRGFLSLVMENENNSTSASPPQQDPPRKYYSWSFSYSISKISQN